MNNTMTEQEAKKRWCPMVRIIMAPQDSTWQNKGITNRALFLKDGFPNCCCIASACMLWRWAESQEEWFHRIEEGKKISGMDTQEAAECLPKLGYCGLAGM